MHPISNVLVAEKDRLLEEGVSPDTIRVFVKERLQDHALYALYNNRVYKHLIFYGGTCLRRIFGLNRMSEDLDFETGKMPNLRKLGDFMSNYFENLELDGVTARVQRGSKVSRVTLKFPILFDLGLSPHHDEKLHLKVEINSEMTGEYPVMATPIMLSRLSAIVKHYDI